MLLSFNVTKSGLKSGSSVNEVGEQLAEFLDGIPGLERIYTGTDDDGYFNRALYTYQGEPIGIDLVCSGAFKGRDKLARVSLKASYKVYVKNGEPHATAVNDYVKSGTTVEGDYTMSCGIFTPVTHPPAEVESVFNMGAWHATTKKGGLLVGIYADDEANVFLKYPVYLGHVRNQFLHEHMVYAVNLNRGAYPQGGVDGSGNALPTRHSIADPANGMANGYAAIVGEANIQPDPAKRTYHKLLLQHVHCSYNAEGNNYISTHYSFCDLPLFATLPDKWCQGWQVDDFYAGNFSPETHPAMLKRYGPPGGQAFVHVSDDGVALRLDGETMPMCGNPPWYLDCEFPDESEE